MSDRHLKDDFIGGLSAAALTLPVSVVLGAFTLEPLGATMRTTGVAAGLFGVALCSLLPVLLGSRRISIVVPRSITAIFVAGMLAEVVATHRELTDALPSPGLLYAVIFLFLALSGTFQALIGLLKAGSVVKYVPYAVLAGFMNAVALLLVAGQMQPLLGLPDGATLGDLTFDPGIVKAGAVFCAVFALAAYALSRRFAPRLPALIMALAAGVLAHYVLAATPYAAQLGGTLGGGLTTLPRFDTIADFPELLGSPLFPDLLPGIAGAAFGLAVISSLDSLLQARAFENISHQRTDNQRELARLGLANAFAPCVGALPCSISLGASSANHNAGARSARSVVVHGLCALLALAVLTPLLGLLPRAVLAAMLIAIAFQAIDRPTLAMAGKLLRGRAADRRRLTADVLTMMLVAAIAMFWSIVAAVVIGIFISVLFFIVHMSQSVVRRVNRGDTLRSRHTRSAAHLELLNQHGASILIVDLQGVLFFGTADDLLKRIDAIRGSNVSCIILDLRRVNDIDTSGAQMLALLCEELHKQGRRLILAHVTEGDALWHRLADSGTLERLPRDAIAPDTDQALERAENDLIARESSTSPAGELTLRALKPLEALSDDELARLAPRLERRSFAQGETVLREGELSADLYLITRGTANVFRQESGKPYRLVTLDAGTAFGELALLSNGVRSASVQANSELVCYVLRQKDFDELIRRQDAAAFKLLIGLTREVASRLRFANETVERLQW